MIPQRVTLENFLSFGERTEIEFWADEPLWVLGGGNGVGKSAVFDAMTFCLYGQHRGGMKKLDSLPRHGTTGFKLSFEFALGGTEYRVARNRTTTPSQSVEWREAGDAAWKRVQHVESGDDITKWTEKTLGLTFDAFKVSVLLRQGEADCLVTGSGPQRLALLKRVVNAGRYEELSARVHAKASAKKQDYDAAARELTAAPAATEETLAVATEIEAAASGDRDGRAAAAVAATGAVGHAKAWATLTVRRTALEEQVRAGDARAADAEATRAGKSRHDLLTHLLPALTPLPGLRGESTRLAAESVGVRDMCAAALLLHQTVSASLAGTREDSRRCADAAALAGSAAAESRRGIERQTHRHRVADDIAKLDAQLAVYAADLDEELARLDTHARATDADERRARDRATQARTLADHARAAHEKFSGVESGVTCSHCLQPVTAEHADRERAQLLASLDGLTRGHAAAGLAATAAAEAKSSALTGHRHAVKLAAERDALRGKLAARRGDLHDAGGTETLAELAASLATLRAEAAGSERDAAAAAGQRDEAEGHAAKLAADCDAAARSLQAAQRSADALAGRLATATAQGDALLARLAPEWHDATASRVGELAGELAALTAAGVVEAFRALEQVTALLGEWRGQLARVAAECDAIPEASRVSLDEAARRERAAVGALAVAEAAWQKARDDLKDHRRHFERYRTLSASAQTLEVEARRLDKLDRHLGKAGLQRHLVREAESAIVAMANETVGKLSGGDLSMALDPAEAKEDEAFALCVRRAGSDSPIAVGFLSGSQKFRVAIAVALAIGRYATNQSHPLECVIIDEGFGSLDKDGLRAAAEELNALKAHLKRIILVSHQDDFTDQFPVVIQLTAGENGTVATKVRR